MLKRRYRDGIHSGLRRYTLFQEIKDIIKAFELKRGKTMMSRRFGFRGGIHACLLRFSINGIRRWFREEKIYD